jgi:hypothetical protein
MRRKFFRELWAGLRVVWPIISGLLIFMGSVGVVIGLQEHWSLPDAIYFAFVTGLTIGYGDLVPTHALSRILAILIGLSGVLLVGLVVAIGVRALERVERNNREG